jgi:hypothetical protein
MKAVPAILLALVCSFPLAAAAQWQWLDKDGRKVFSDKAPPPDIAPNRILKAPGGRSMAPAPEAPVASAAPAASAAKPAGTDKALEDKRKQIAAAEEEQKKAEEAKLAAAKVENCNRARVSKATMESGLRVARVNDKGEREFLDANQRASELKTINDVIARDCK